MTNCTTFLDVNRRLGEKPALIFPAGNVTYSYGELFEAVCRRSNFYLKKGIRKGDRLCVYLPANPEYLLSYLALWRIGAVAVPLNIVLSDSEVHYMLRNSGSAAIITDKSGEKNAKTACAKFESEGAGNVPMIFTTGDGGFEAEVAEMPDYIRAVNVEADCLCQLQYTSGTTGQQKGAMLTHGNWMAAFDAESSLMKYTYDDVYLGIYPMAHVGVSWGISALKAGSTWVIMEKFEMDRYIEYAEKYKVTVIAGMPPVIHSLVKMPPGTEDKFRTCKEMISGGGPLHPSVWKEFHYRYGIPIINAYGLSETIVVGTGTAIRQEDYRTADEFKSVGAPVGFTEMKIVNTEDPSIELEDGSVGEVALRGPAIAKGYWMMPTESAKVFLPDGWFLTGDIGFIDGDGMLSITDRKKDMIVMSGWKVYPTEVEKAYIEHPDIDDIAIFGCPDIHRGEIPVAAVVFKKNKVLTDEELIEYGMSKLARYKVPRNYIRVDELPRVNGWKLLRRELREKYCSNFAGRQE